VNSPAPESSPMAIVDERWLHEWINFGMLHIAVYLTNHAAFTAYCENLDESTPAPDGPVAQPPA
jgi:hypothetical protein